MLEKENQDPHFRIEVRRIIRMYSEIVESLSEVEFRENHRLRKQIQYVADQMRLCLEVAKSFDGWR